MNRLLVALLATTAGVTLARARVDIPVTSCGQMVRRGESGTLMADLACGHQWGTCYACATSCPVIQPVVPCSGPSECPDPAVNKCEGGENPVSVGVYLEPGARLYLNGHSISSVQIGIGGFRPDGTAGPQRIRVFGPGTIFKTREGASFYNASFGEGVTLADSLVGITGSKARVKDVDTSGNVVGVSVFETLRATRATSDNNRYAGILSYSSMRVSFSHATGNAVIDITSERPPRLTVSTCDHSAALEETGQPGVYAPTGPPWGVCSGD
jgi:hypothetical protein